MIKRAVVFILIFSALILLSPNKVQAASLTATIQQMIDSSIAPLQTSITNLQNRLTALETAVDNILTRLQVIENNITGLQTNIETIFNRLATNETVIADHETRVASLENSVPDFTPPTVWIPAFSSINQTITLKNTQTVSNACVWNGIVINSQQVQVRAVAHLVGGDIFTTGNCQIITFSKIVDFPTTGSSFFIDLDLFWQGKTKHSRFSVVAP
ncbi:MAG: hypothetical protein V1803_00825 [Candidatus Roizmanbacteria bacterium]